MVLALLGLFGMMFYLHLSAFDNVKRGLNSLVLCGVALAVSALGVLMLMTVSTQEVSWAVAIVPARLLIILSGAVEPSAFCLGCDAKPRQRTRTSTSTTWHAAAAPARRPTSPRSDSSR